MVSDGTMDLFVPPLISITHQMYFSRTIKCISITLHFFSWIIITIITEGQGKMVLFKKRVLDVESLDSEYRICHLPLAR